MPNWTSTNFSVYGPQKEVEDFYNGIDADREQGQTSILHTYLPCPEELKITSTTAWESPPEKWAEYIADGSWTQEDYDNRVASNNTMFVQQQKNLAEYGCKDWYDWEHKHWGVKWGDCDTEINPPYESIYKDIWVIKGYFQTPWGTATNGWMTISKRFPNCIFDFTSDEEAGFFAGIEATKNGDVVFSEYYYPCEDYAPEVDWSNDDSIQHYEDWKEEKALFVTCQYESFLKTTDMRIKPVPKKTTPVLSTGPAHFWKLGL